MLGGALYDNEGRLRLVADLARSDYTNLFSSRRDRLVFEKDASTGKSCVPQGPLYSGKRAVLQRAIQLEVVGFRS